MGCEKVTKAARRTTNETWDERENGKTGSPRTRIPAVVVAEPQYRLALYPTLPLRGMEQAILIS